MKLPNIKRFFLSLIVQMFDVSQDSATVPTSKLEEYEKGIPMSKAVR